MSAVQTEPATATITLGDVAATTRFAHRCAAKARRGDVVALSGGLGTGKTTFARGFVNAVADREGAPREEVPSPTFTLVQVYEFPENTVFHFDLYRLEGPAETVELGVEEAFADGISLIEWPDRLATGLPSDRLELSFDFGDLPDARRCDVRGFGSWASRTADLLPDG